MDPRVREDDRCPSFPAATNGIQEAMDPRVREDDGCLSFRAGNNGIGLKARPETWLGRLRAAQNYPGSR